MQPSPASKLATGLALAGLLVASTPAASAQPPDPVAVPAAPSPAPGAASTAAAATSTVVLLTGDRVTVGTEPGGERTFTVQPAPRTSGVPVSFTSAADGEHFYVIPSDASPYLAADVLDLQLFDVAGLAAEGRTAAGGPPPVIVQYDGARTPAALARSADPLPGTPLTLESIGAVAIDPAAGQGPAVWSALTRSANARAGERVRKVWLDRKVTADLDVSVPQIGAPAVWQAGYDGTGVTVAVLDTGIDQAHPDLAGKVIATRNLTTDPSVADGNGHGTHVASTVAGTGAASGGKYKGVAPGADLMVGKVLTDGGNGFMSWAIEGMEWAARNGADVVNLSLSAGPTDGTDPGSQAVDALSAETGTLFVIASGNDYSDAAVGTPGAAAAALTVGAVDDQDLLADFSNRGPRRGDAAVKPNLTAPGVQIVAARATGTSMGSPVDAHYTAASGTSMATPHVAGSAALLAQAHPGWRGTDLKDALVSTADPGAYTPFQQGAGRVDVAEAFGTRLRGPAVADFGRVPDPSTEPVVRRLDYHNDTTADVTLQLSVSGRGWDGRELPAGALRLSATALTVPAGGSGTVDLVADPALLDAGVHSGIVSASAAGVELRTPWSLYEASGTHTLSTSLLDRRGEPADPGLPIWVVKTNPGFVANDPFRSWHYFAWSDAEGNASFDVAPGVYDVYSQITTWELDATESTIAIGSEIQVGADTAVTLDARQAKRRNPRVGESVDLMFGEIGVIRKTPDDRTFWVSAMFEESTDWDLYSTPSATPVRGSAESYTKWTYGSELVDVRGNGAPALHPEYWPHAAGPALAGRRTLPVVVADTDGDLPRARDGLALIRIGISADEPFKYAYFLNELQRRTDLAAANGVAGVLAYADLPGAQAHQVRAEPILQLGLSRAEGEALRRAVGRQTGLRLTVDGRQSPERVYHLRLGHDDGFPATGDPLVGKHELATLPARYHSDTPQQTGSLAWFAFSPNMSESGQIAIPFRAPAAWTELAASRGPQIRWLRQTWLEDTTMRSWDRLAPGERRELERWFQSPVHYGAMDVAGSYPTTLTCTFCRQGDRFVTGQYRMDAQGKHYEYAWFDPPEVRLFRGDTEIPRQGGSWRWFQLPPGPGTYKLSMRYTQPGSAPEALAPRIETDWVFRSAPPTAGTLPAAYSCPFSTSTSPCGFDPLIQLRHDLGLSLGNAAPAGRSHTFGLHAGPMAGAVDRTPVSGVRVWYSTDDGTSWKQASVEPSGRGNFTVSVRHPRLADTNGYVWLRTRAWNAAGDSVEQTVHRAYRLENR